MQLSWNMQTKMLSFAWNFVPSIKTINKNLKIMQMKKIYTNCVICTQMHVSALSISITKWKVGEKSSTIYRNIKNIIPTEIFNVNRKKIKLQRQKNLVFHFFLIAQYYNLNVFILILKRNAIDEIHYDEITCTYFLLFFFTIIIIIAAVFVFVVVVILNLLYFYLYIRRLVLGTMPSLVHPSHVLFTYRSIKETVFRERIAMTYNLC